ncbi:energy transducer TonB [Sphingomonas sinipercae]|uniref:energy transducer TonB n=1 Tax=Sphingomonas sinipercae TaxID=2714944 RepID=UPI001FE998ED|nr:TonB family protein [Sphingomonas sinipercae]
MPPRERFIALAAAAVIQLGLLLALLCGLQVSVGRIKDTAQELIEVALPPLPIPEPTKIEILKQRLAAKAPAASAPKAVPAPLGGLPGIARPSPMPSVEAIVPIRPTAPATGGGTGTGPAVGSGAGGGTGGAGTGPGEEGDGGGTELEQIGGEILPRDYPRRLGNAGIGGQVGVTFTVEVNGRADRCRVRRSSGIPELDQLTCRLIEQRFRFRPGTDRFGRPIADEVEYDHEWTVNR